MDVTWRDYVDAQDAATRAQNDARFAEVLSKIDGLSGRIDALPRPPTIWQIAGVVAAGFGLVLAALAYAADRFDGGISASGILDEFEARQEARDAAQDEQLQAITNLLQGIDRRLTELGTE